jgi:hypothetical protein
MRQLVDRSGERYAVIEAHWTKGPPERFVIAYRDEECLRDLIAAPSIIATGFASREGAASIAACLSARAVSKKTQKALAVDGSETDQRGTQSPTQRWRDGFGLAETRRIARGALQHAVAATMLMFYSRSVLSAAIRSFVGASF